MQIGSLVFAAASLVKRAFIAGLVITALVTWAGETMVPVVSASSSSAAAPQDRGADREASVARTVPRPFRPESVVDARRRPQALALSAAAAAVPFVCAVHLAEAEAEAAAASD